MSTDLFESVEGSLIDLDKKAKELSPIIDKIITQRDVEKVPELLKLKDHSSVQIRRKVAVGVSTIGSKEDVQSLKSWQESESDRKTWLTLEVAIDRLNHKISGGEEGVKVCSVSEALYLLKQTVGNKDYIIEGEVAQVDIYGQGRVYYITLKDGDDNIRSMAFETVVSRLGFALNQGLNIRIHGQFKISGRGGIYLSISKIELTGEGEYLRNLKILEQKLEKEGLFDESRKRKIPKLPKKILLIASPNSAAIDDYLKVLEKRRGGVAIYHLPIKTQGIGAERILIEALERANDVCDEYDIDTIVMTRGGGGKEDLKVFDSEAVTRAIYSLVRPSVVAIGHERDNSLAEMVADLRCSTPSQAAEMSSLSYDEVRGAVSSTTNAISRVITEKTSLYVNYKNQVLNNISRLAAVKVQTARQVCNETNSAIFSSVSRVRSELDSIYSSSVQSVKYRLQSHSNSVDSLDLRSSLKYNLQNKLSEYEKLRLTIDAYDPKKNLEKGYAMLKSKDRVISSIKDLVKNEKYELELNDGSAEIRVV